MRGVVPHVAACAIMALPAYGQPAAEPADSAWVADVLPIVRTLAAGVDIRAVGADSMRHFPPSATARARVLARALAADRAVPGPGAVLLTPDGQPDCAVGTTAWVQWYPRESPDRAILGLGFSCRLNGRPFAHGLEQPVIRGADGRWRTDGPVGGWTS